MLEVKVRLLEQLSCGFNSPQLAIEFIQMLLDEYAILCNALPSLLFLLKPVVCMYVCVYMYITGERSFTRYVHIYTFTFSTYLVPIGILVMEELRCVYVSVCVWKR